MIVFKLRIDDMEHHFPDFETHIKGKIISGVELLKDLEVVRKTDVDLLVNGIKELRKVAGPLMRKDLSDILKKAGVED